MDILTKQESLLVPSVGDDERLRILATLAARFQALDLHPILIYDIDNVDESALPALGEQFHIMGNEGWSFVETEQQKRDLIKKSIELHRYKGTAWAVEESIRIFDYKVGLVEWFEYGGNPYCFCVDINLYDEVWRQREWEVIYGLIWRWKNARSHLDKLRVTRQSKAQIRMANATLVGEVITVYPWQPKDIETTARANLAAGIQIIETVNLNIKN